MRIIAIVTAAGSGSRFSSNRRGLPKQFQNLNGLPVIIHSLRVFQNSRLIEEVIISADPKYFDFLHRLSNKHKISKLTTLVEGGKTRFQSVKNAFFQTEGKKGDRILIHDAARPNIGRKPVEDLISASKKFGEVIPGIRISETVKREKSGIVHQTVDRNNLWLVQTPQVFRHEVLLKAYQKAGRKSDFTDESALVEFAGYKVRIIEGEKNNIKITTPDEIKTLKKLM
jgi:2-C-methyl-D-erythritol 4-phosphate cytidylyltransferase